MVTVKITVKGRVQGVFYRFSTKKKADELAIKGYAKNMSDGSVEVMAQGRLEDVNDLIRWCESGPLLANVIDIKSIEVENSDVLLDFYTC